MKSFAPLLTIVALVLNQVASIPNPQDAAAAAVDFGVGALGETTNFLKDSITGVTGTQGKWGMAAIQAKADLAKAKLHLQDLDRQLRLVRDKKWDIDGQIGVVDRSLQYISHREQYHRENVDETEKRKLGGLGVGEYKAQMRELKSEQNKKFTEQREKDAQGYVAKANKDQKIREALLE